MRSRAPRRALVVALLSFFVVLPGCGGGGDSPTGPGDGDGDGPANEPPTASISAPEDGATFAEDEEITFEGSADDPEDGALTGDALTWESSQEGQIGTGGTVTTSSLATGDHTITLTATDSDGATDEATISVTVEEINEPPTATIESPARDTMVEQGGELTLEGEAEDPEDGTLTGDRLTWTSDVDGELGNGETVTVSLTADTSHAITLEATDSEGASAETSVGVSVLPPAGEPLSDQQRADATAAVMGEIDETFPDDLGDTGDRDPVEEVKTAAREIAEEVAAVELVEVIDGTASATVVFQDGLEFVLINNRPLPESGSAGQGLTPAPAQPARAVPPASEEAVAAFVDFGEGVQADIQGILSEAGYSVDSDQDASLQDMRSYSGLGALYLDTHGTIATRYEIQGTGQDAQPQAVEGNIFALGTSTPLPDPGDGLRQWFQNHRNLLESGQLVVGSEGNTAIAAVTPEFIRQHWSFDGGVVMIHACFVAAEGIGTEKNIFGSENVPCTENCNTEVGAEVLSAVLDAGADVVVGTDRATNASLGGESIRFLFDRLVGANEVLPVSPPPRPFPAEDVEQEMERRGLDEFTHPGASFYGVFSDRDVQLVFRGDLDRGILAPSIKNFEIVDDAAEADGEMTLHGSFPEEEGQVTVADNEVSVTSWTTDEIVARVPFEGAAASGAVEVEGPEEIPSNPVPLTRWEGTVQGELASCDAVASGEANVRFRADIHRRRDALGEEAEAPQEVRAYIAPPTESSAQASGRTGSDCDEPNATWTDARSMETLTKEEVDQGAPTLDFTRSTFGGFALVRPRSDEVQLCEQLSVSFTSQAEGRSDPLLAPFLSEIAANTGQLNFPAGAFGCFTATLDEGDAFSAPSEVIFDPDDVQTWRAQWTGFTVEAPPDAETPG